MLKAATEAGISADEAKTFIEDCNAGVRETKEALRESAMNGIDAVPNIVIEGKRRDFSFEGAKEVEEFEKALHQVAKESK